MDGISLFFRFVCAAEALSSASKSIFATKMAFGAAQTQLITTENVTQRAQLRNLRRSKPDLFRLSTFRSWKSNTKMLMSPAVLAKGGFSYTEKGDRVRCDTCGLEIDGWKPGMDPKQEHAERSPQCPFVLSQAALFPKNGISFILSQV